MACPTWGPPAGMDPPDKASGPVITAFNNASVWASSAMSQALAAIASLSGDFTAVYTTPNIQAPPPFGYKSISIAVPEEANITTFTGVAPNTLTVPTLTLDEVQQIPGFDVDPMVIDLPERPDDTLPTEPDDAPALSDITFADRPSYTLPTVPVFDEHSIPDPPDYFNPEFDATEPVDNVNLPSTSFSWAEEFYSSQLLDALRYDAENGLYYDIHEGGIGMSATSQQDLIDMETERDTIIRQDAMDEYAGIWAESGWPLPDGILAANLQRIDTEWINKRLDKSRDIRVEAEKLAIENMRFAKDQARQLETAWNSYYSEYNNRKLEAEKARIDAVIKIFQAEVQKYLADVEIYKAKAYVFEVKIRASIANAELYKARLDAVKTLIDIDKSYVDLYVAQIRGIELLIETYKTDMEASKIKADINRLVLEAAKLETDIYLAKIQARVAAYNMYEAATRGEMAKAEIYKAQVEAYRARVQAISIEHTTAIEKLKAESEVERTKVENYRGQVQGYLGEIQAWSQEMDTLIKNYLGHVEVYKADGSVKVGEYGAEAQAWSAQAGYYAALANVAVKSAEAAMQATAETAKVRIAGLDAAARAAAQMAAGAMASCNASAHISYTGSAGVSTSYGAHTQNSNISYCSTSGD